MRLFAGFAVLWISTPAVAGPWTKSTGEAYVKLSGSVFSSDTYVDPTGFVVEGVDHTSLSTALYAEVGVARRLAASLYLPHVSGRNAYANGDAYASLGFGDTQLALSWSTPWLDFPHAIRLGTKVPLYDLGAVRGFEAGRFPARGDGQIDFSVAASAGDGFQVAGLSAYAFAEIGHVFRTEWFTGSDDGRELLDSFSAFAQAGLTPFSLLTLALQAQGVMPYREDRLSKAYLSIGGAIYAHLLAGLSVELGVDAIVAARNGSLGASYSLGVSYAL